MECAGTLEHNQVGTQRAKPIRSKGADLMRSVILTLLIVTVFVYVTPVFAADVTAGKELFGKKCASCHGASGEGKASVAKALKVEIRNLGSKEVQTKSDADLKKVLLEGTGKMKGVKDIDAKGADDIVAYMRTFAKK